MLTLKKKWKRKKIIVPTVLQMEATECGAACLGMILEFYGKNVSLEELREECNISRDGSNAFDIVEAAERYGLNAVAFTKEPDGLRNLKLPCIIFWKFCHFVVFTGIKGGKFYINDPALGPRTISEEEFDKSFTGVVLTFEPGKTFKKGGSSHGIISSLNERLKGFKIAVIFVLLVGLFLVMPGLIIPAITKIFVDNILIGGMKDWLKPLLCGLAIAGIAQTFLSWLQRYFLLRFSTALSLKGAVEFFSHLFKLPIHFFASRFPGEISNRISMNDRIANLISGDFAASLLNTVTIVFFGILMFYYNKELTFLVVFVTVLNFIVLKLISEQRKVLSQNVLIEEGKLVGLTMNGIQMIETLKANGAEEHYFRKWAGIHAKEINFEQSLRKYSMLLTFLPAFLSKLTSVAVLMIGTLFIIEGRLTIGTLVAFQVLMGSFMAPVSALVSIGSNVNQAQADINRLNDVLNTEEDEPFKNRINIDTASSPAKEKSAYRNHNTKSKIIGNVDLDNLCFGYNKGSDSLIKDFNLSLKSGNRIALVGATGAGKSTILKLIIGLHKPWSGKILFDKKNKLEYPFEIVNNSIAYVDQNIFLYEGTVKENITMWNSLIPDNDVILAAKDACIHEDIVTRSSGYESMIAESGRNFSGGQRQRMEIARALVSNPSILILDEATSALDAKTEYEIDNNIRRRGCTCIIVSHRLSTIRDCDEIIVMDDGIIHERGTHDQLMNNTKSIYKDLIMS
jgi:NHLM bacteriocin system ABC transporter peptidase/ATP-binding protein